MSRVRLWCVAGSTLESTSDLQSVSKVCADLSFNSNAFKSFDHQVIHSFIQALID